MKSTSELAAAVASFREDEERESKLLSELAEEAEASGDYYEYDQACYSSWEYMSEVGARLAGEVEFFLERSK